MLNIENNPFHPPAFVPTCLSSHIRIISMKGFQGKCDEMDATKYLLTFGLVMKKMTVSTTTAAGVVIPPRPKEEIYKEISMFECGSESCHVQVL
ncbi:hypothetical protein ACE6H2_000498 [Prunus campanulata]